MKYYLRADDHFRLDSEDGKFSLLRDSIGSFNFMLDKADEDKEPKVLIILGDLFDRCIPAPLVNKVVIELLSHAVLTFDHVYILLGNHGNNDSNEDALSPIEKAFADEITVIRDIEIIDDRFVTLPHISRKIIYKDIPPSTPYDEAVSLHIDTWEKKEKKKLGDYIVLGHVLIKGAKYGAEDILLREQAYKISNLRGAELGFFGHIHKEQTIKSKNGGTYHYIGGQTITDFSERDEKKRYMIFDSSPGTVKDVFGKTESINVPCMKWQQLDLNYKNSYSIKDADFVGIKDKRVKLNITASEKTYYLLDKLQLADKVAEKGGLMTQYVVTRTDKKTAKNKEDQVTRESFFDNITKAIKEFVKGMDEPKPVLDSVYKMCIDNVDVSKYNKVQEGKGFLYDSITLKNFLGYRDETVKFTSGLIGILGDKGSGKSAIIDGIRYALTGEERGEVAGCSINTYSLAEGTADMQVTLNISMGKDILKVERGRKGAGAKPFAELRMNEGEPLASGDMDVTNKIAEIIGVDDDTLVNTSLFRQKFQDDFMQANPQTRDKYIRKYFGLDFVTDAFESLKEIRKDTRRDLNDAQSSAKTYELELSEYDHKILKENLEECEGVIVDIDKEINRLSKAVEKGTKVASQISEIPDLEVKCNRLQEDIATIEHTINEKSKCKDRTVEIKEVDKKREVLASSRNKLADKADSIEKLLEEQRLVCPACKAKLVLEEGELRKDSASKTAEELQAELDKLDVKIAEDDGKIDEYDQDLVRLKKWQREYEEAADYIKVRKTIVKEKKDEYTANREKLNKLRELQKGLDNTNVSSAKLELERYRDAKETEITKRTGYSKDLETYNKLKKSLTKLTKQVKVYQHDLKVVELALSVFDKNGVIVSILNTINQSIEEWANHILSKLSTETVFVDMNKTSIGIAVLIDWEGSKKEYVMYSGGEESIINFSIRMGFSLSMSDMTGFVPSSLILDEVLGALDDNSKYELIRIINYLSDKGFRQIICITHTTIRDYLKNVIQIVKENRESKVVR